MFGILLDAVALWVITVALAKRDVSEDLLRFFVFAAVLAAVGVGLVLGEVGLPLAIAMYFAVFMLGMKFFIGASWAGAAVASLIFAGYRVALGMVFAA